MLVTTWILVSNSFTLVRVHATVLDTYSCNTITYRGLCRRGWFQSDSLQAQHAYVDHRVPGRGVEHQEWIGVDEHVAPEDSSGPCLSQANMHYSIVRCNLQ